MKSLSKRKKANTKNKSNILRTVAWTLSVIALIMGSMAIGYLLGYDKALRETLKQEKTKEAQTLALLKEKKVIAPSTTVTKRLKEVLKKGTVTKEELTKKKEILKVKSYAGASHEYATTALAKPPSRIKKETKQSSRSKPKLAIIIDDVSVKSQVHAIKSLGLKLTMSFLPPSSARPNSALLASKESFYMVHLPMEAQSYSAEEPNTLRINDSQSKISARIGKIKKLFPKVHHINNHTGSKYTENETAMKRLFVALNANNIEFIDSRTTAKTKAPAIMKSLGKKYIARDVFLDHKMDKAYIITQIKRAVKIAKSEGSAIAIGHPHANTILALNESKYLFKDIDLILVNKLY